MLYLTKLQESPGEASLSSHDVQVEKDNMFSRGHRAKITAVPLKEYACKSDNTIKKQEIKNNSSLCPQDLPFQPPKTFHPSDSSNVSYKPNVEGLLTCEQFSASRLTVKAMP